MAYTVIHTVSFEMGKKERTSVTPFVVLRSSRCSLVRNFDMSFKNNKPMTVSFALVHLSFSFTKRAPCLNVDSKWLRTTFKTLKYKKQFLTEGIHTVLFSNTRHISIKELRKHNRNTRYKYKKLNPLV